MNRFSRALLGCTALSLWMAGPALAAPPAATYPPGLGLSGGTLSGPLTMGPANSAPGSLVWAPFAQYYNGTGLQGSQAPGIGGLLAGGPSAAIYPIFEQPWFKTSSFTSGSPTFTVSDNGGLRVGQEIVDANMTSGARIKTISGNTITSTANATATASDLAQFGRQRWDAYSNFGANVLAGKRGYFGAAAQYATSPLAGGADLPNGPALYSISPDGGSGALFATLSSLDTGSVYGRSIADAAYAYNDNTTTAGKTAWARYTQAVNSSGISLTTFGEESSVGNTVDSAIVDPYQVNVGNSVFNHRVDCGNGYGYNNKCTAAFQLISNGGVYQSGFIFNNGSITPRMSASTSEAIALAQNYALDWYSAANTPTWHMYASAGSGGGALVMGASTLYLYGNPQVSDGNAYLSVKNTGNGEARIGPSGGNMVAIDGGTTGVTPSIQPANAGNTATNLQIGGSNGGGLLVSSPLQKTVSGTVAAAGTTQATATVATSDIVVVTSGTGGIKIASNTGGKQSVYNRSGSTINVYPTGSGQIEAFGVNAPASLANGGHATFECVSGSQCYQAP